MNICISNLNSSVRNEELKQLFAGYGEVASAEVMMDAFTDKSRGFGFVEMENEEEARKAITELNNTTQLQSLVKVEEAAPKEVRKGSYKVGNGAVNVYRFRKN